MYKIKLFRHFSCGLTRMTCFLCSHIDSIFVTFRRLLNYFIFLPVTVSTMYECFSLQFSNLRFSCGLFGVSLVFGDLVLVKKSRRSIEVAESKHKKTILYTII